MSRQSLVSVVVVLLTINAGALKTLFVRQDDRSWALPHAKLDSQEPLRRCAERVVQSWLGQNVDYLEQLYTFGNDVPPTGARSIEVAYYGLVPSDLLSRERLSQRQEANWFATPQTPELAGNHAQIARTARNRLRGKLAYTAVGFELLPDVFTLAELQNLYEIILGKQLDKRNFRKKINELGILEPTAATRSQGGGRGRPASLYRFKPEVFRQLEAKGDIFAF